MKSQEERLGDFLSRVFRDEGVRSLGQARARIESEFRDKYRTQQDLLGFLREQRSRKARASLPYTMGVIGSQRAKSNHSMPKESSSEDQDEDELMDVEEGSNLEEAKEDAPSLLLKCKTVGRLGPATTRLDLASANGSLKLVE